MLIERADWQVSQHLWVEIADVYYYSENCLWVEILRILIVCVSTPQTFFGTDDQSLLSTHYRTHSRLRNSTREHESWHQTFQFIALALFIKLWISWPPAPAILSLSKRSCGLFINVCWCGVDSLFLLSIYEDTRINIWHPRSTQPLMMTESANL